MTINGINGANTQIGQMGMNQVTDSYSRNIQNQIAEAQKQLQELSSNKDMTQEEKMTHVHVPAAAQPKSLIHLTTFLGFGDCRIEISK